MLSASLTSIDLVSGDDDETYLSGVLPTEIGRLEKLAFLNLNGNKASVNLGIYNRIYMSFVLAYRDLLLSSSNGRFQQKLGF